MSNCQRCQMCWNCVIIVYMPLTGRGPTRLRARVRNRDRLENRSHVVPKTEFQNGGGRTRIFTHKITIFGLVCGMIYQFLGMEAKNYKFGMFCQQCHPNAIHPWPQVMPIFDREMPPGFTPAICLRRNFVYISNLENRGDKSLNQNFKNIVFNRHADTAKQTGPRTFADKRWVGPVKLLCIIMFNISKIRSKSPFGPVKAQKFL